MPGRGDIERLHEELEQLFDDLWRVPRFAGARRGFRPAVDVFQTENPLELNVVVDLAGVDPEHVHVVAAEGVLVIAGDHPRPQSECPRSYHHLEIQYGPFERRISLPENVDSEAARAEYRHGLLTIVLPLAEKPAPPLRAAIPVRRER